jgi:hypothetical protein
VALKLQRLFSLYSLMWNVQESPAQEGYRNKCEFTIGFHPVTLKLTVGFRLGQYSSGLILAPAEILNFIMRMRMLSFLEERSGVYSGPKKRL